MPARTIVPDLGPVSVWDAAVDAVAVAGAPASASMPAGADGDVAVEVVVVSAVFGLRRNFLAPKPAPPRTMSTTMTMMTKFNGEMPLLVESVGAAPPASGVDTASSLLPMTGTHDGIRIL